jgi:hypothetical protein
MYNKQQSPCEGKNYHVTFSFIDHWLLIIIKNTLSIVFLLMFGAIKNLNDCILKDYEK